jgi:hypothetical protein
MDFVLFINDSPRPSLRSKEDYILPSKKIILLIQSVERFSEAEVSTLLLICLTFY